MGPVTAAIRARLAAAQDLPPLPLLPELFPPKPGPLAELAALLRGSRLATSAPDLKTATVYRQHWAQLETERQLAVALRQTPANAGPLNSERLALHTLQTVQQLSPAYLQRLLSQLDGLHWLAQTDPIPRANFASPPRAAAPTREKPHRSPPAKAR